MLLVLVFSLALAQTAAAERVALGCLNIATPNAKYPVSLKFESGNASKIVVSHAITSTCLTPGAYDVFARAKNGSATATLLVYPGTTRHVTLLLDPQVTINLDSPAPAISSFNAPISGLAVRTPDLSYTVSLMGKIRRLIRLDKSALEWTNETGVIDGRTTFFDFLPPGEYVADIQGGNFELKRSINISPKGGGIHVIDITLRDIVRSGRVIWHKY